MVAQVYIQALLRVFPSGMLYARMGYTVLLRSAWSSRSGASGCFLAFRFIPSPIP